MQAKHRADLFGAATLEQAQASPLFHPAKHLLDPSAGVNRHGVAIMADGGAISGGTAGASGVLGHVRCHTDTPHLSGETMGVIVLVGA
jgi:hypothetical protein